MKLDVFGTRVEVTNRNGEWLVFYSGPDGKKRKAEDILIPNHILQNEVISYVGDLCHEWATPEKSEVKVVE
ncbi:hypothetical protein [Alteromonas sp. KUL49]|uniref:DUF7661 family protein n=1 Tax=Alteromonas sp. KUL49 TaxID=2480798 RepID=UPI00102F25B6|nr:hypothetical protein [Alteromonas sp. KUL49]TAP41013.1 hypothetical protein EYS00_07895 [Alteromonas sp. KUL49]GEA11208.1 hypothetical protein KUL49_15830 [Alteromonas sp. KUL49]